LPEANVDASLLIAISWQALGRLRSGEKQTRISNCAVVIVFAAFFIEANLNHIVKKLGKKREMTAFLNGQKYPGLRDKLAWFYNEFVARKRSHHADKPFKKRIGASLRRKYPGFSAIHRFRNNLSHGRIDLSKATPAHAEVLRRQAKGIVESLYRTLEENGHPVRRTVWYNVAIGKRP